MEREGPSGYSLTDLIDFFVGGALMKLCRGRGEDGGLELSSFVTTRVFFFLPYNPCC